MDNNENQPNPAVLTAQVAFAKSYEASGHKIIATAQSWADTKSLQDALQSKGVQAEGIALDPLGKREGVFDQNTVVIWGDSDPRVLKHAQQEIDLLEEKVLNGTPGVSVYLVSGAQYKLLPGPDLATAPGRKPSM